MTQEAVSTEVKDGRRILRLSGRLDVSAAGRLHASALEAARSGEAVAVDAGEVEFLGAAALQVLAALHRRLAERGGLGWVAASDEARAFAALGGFDPSVLGGPDPSPKEEAS